MADRLIERVNVDMDTLSMDAWLFSIADGSISNTVNYNTYYDSLRDRFESEIYPTILKILVEIDSEADPETGM